MTVEGELSAETKRLGVVTRAPLVRNSTKYATTRPAEVPLPSNEFAGLGVRTPAPGVV